VDQALRRYLATDDLTAAAGAVLHAYAAPAQQGVCHGLEMRQFQLSRTQRDHADAPGDVGRGAQALVEQPRQAPLQWRDLRTQQTTGLQLSQQLLHGE
jgi:hypothetical protein